MGVVLVLLGIVIISIFSTNTLNVEDIPVEEGHLSKKTYTILAIVSIIAMSMCFGT